MQQREHKVWVAVSKTEVVVRRACDESVDSNQQMFAAIQHV